MRRRAFTLIEILVVIGILVLLAGILIPVVTRSMRSAKKARTAADMQAIGTGLEAYKADFGEYPPVAVMYYKPTPSDPSPPTFQNQPDRPNPKTGAQVICQAMFGLADAVEPPGYPTAVYNGTAVPLVFLKQDGKDGPGFRARAGGKPYGPYLALERFKVGYPKGVTPTQDEPLLKVILDGNDEPILYFPAVVNRPIAPANGYIARATATDEPPSMYDAQDNFDAFRRTGEADPVVLTRIQTSFGDVNGNGGIDPAEKARFTQPYVLWSSGYDELFGTDDDITN